MTTKQIEEFNELCAEFIGLERTNVDGVWGTIKHLVENPDSKLYCTVPAVDNIDFYNNWHNLIVVKSMLCELDVIDEFVSKYDSFEKGYSCYIQPSYKNTFDCIYSSNHKSEIEALVEVIYVFLIWRFITLKQITNGSKT